ncbi:MAG: Bro-N domain-containing protein [bacterium]
MNKGNSIILFSGKKVRRHWDKEKELWHFSVIDIVEVLTETDRPRKYWNDLKIKLEKEGSELSDKIGQLKLIASDGKKYLTDVADTETIFRLIQSIPSPKAEPFKLWLAEVGYQRIEETEDPELSINRAIRTYLNKGYSKEWISQRIKSIEIRKELTDEWSERGMKEERDFAMLTNILTETWSGVSIREYKELKGLKKESLRDNMTNIEYALNTLAEASTTEISKVKKPEGVEHNISIVKEAGSISKEAREKIEKSIETSVITKQNIKTISLKGKESPKEESKD